LIILAGPTCPVHPKMVYLSVSMAEPASRVNFALTSSVWLMSIAKLVSAFLANVRTASLFVILNLTAHLTSIARKSIPDTRSVCPILLAKDCVRREQNVAKPVPTAFQLYPFIWRRTVPMEWKVFMRSPWESMSVS
jgi:hypothetical protein